METIVVPIVHDNGTSKRCLLEYREAAYSSLQDALESLKEMSPNGRDYYPDPGRFEKAVAQHTRRMRVITDLMVELEAECAAINGIPGDRYS